MAKLSKTFTYFAYCTNMLTSRMECCVGMDVKRVGTGKLENYKLMFGKFSPIYYGTLPSIVKQCDCEVWGALWEIPECLKPKLDELMGVKSDIYVPLTVQLSAQKTSDGKCTAYTYQLKETPAVPELKNGIWRTRFRPSKLYQEDLVDGAEESCLPLFYRRWLRRIPHNGYTGSVKPDLFDDRDV